MTRRGAGPRGDNETWAREGQIEVCFGGYGVVLCKGSESMKAATRRFVEDVAAAIATLAAVALRSMLASRRLPGRAMVRQAVIHRRDRLATVASPLFSARVLCLVPRKELS